MTRRTHRTGEVKSTVTLRVIATTSCCETSVAEGSLSSDPNVRCCSRTVPRSSVARSRGVSQYAQSNGRVQVSQMDCVPARGVDDRAFPFPFPFPLLLVQVRGAAGKDSSPGLSVSSATLAAAM
jgi:hypothetical protein